MPKPKFQLPKDRKDVVSDFSIDHNHVVGDNMLDLLTGLTKNIPKAAQDKYHLLKSDYERIDFALKIEEIHSGIKIEKGFVGKNAEKAAELKQKGNEAFGKKKYLLALEKYNECILLTPSEEQTVDLSLVIANRSAALLHLTKFDLCLSDIENAISFNYPEEMKYKLFDRKGKCYAQLKQLKDAESNFQEAKKLLETSNLDEKGRELWETSLEKQTKFLLRMQEDPLPGPPAPLKVKENDTKFQNASSKFDIAAHKKSEVGRFALSKESITIGEVMIKEKPFSSIPFTEFYESHCYHCLARARLPIPCYKTGNVVFCSKTCRENAWNTYYQKELVYQNHLATTWCGRIGHLALRMATDMGYDKLKSTMDHLLDEKEPESILDKGITKEGIYSNDYNAIFPMMVNMHKRLPEGLLDFGIFAVYLLKILQHMGYFESTTNDVNLKYSAELVLIGTSLMKNLQVIQCNSQHITELCNTNDFENPKPIDIGAGIYPTAALINHSCDPNCDVNFYANELHVIATRSIKAGEEITIDYGVLFYRTLLKWRKHVLQFRYCFECDCKACKQDWKHWRDIEREVPTFKCPNCGKLLEIHGKLVDKENVKCKNSKCNEIVNLKTTIKILQANHDKFAMGIDMCMNGKCEDALPKLVDHMLMLQKYLNHPWQELVRCQDAIRTVYRLRANTRLDI